MTRLTEALERARATSGDAVPTLVPRSGQSAHRSVADVPSTWQLDQETLESVEGRASHVNVPNTWQIDEAAIKGAEPTVEFHATEGLAPTEAGVRPQVEGFEPAGDVEQLEIKSAEPEKLVVGPAADAVVVEQYRSLAAALHHAQHEGGAHTVMITSAVEAEGKTLTATNLALTLSFSFLRRVLLVDADLRRPGIHELLQRDNRVGLGQVLKQAASGRRLPVQRVSRMLWVMTAGPADPDPMGGLVSDTMRQFLVEAAEQFDWIVIDTPPVAVLSDANLLAAMTDTVLLVVSAGSTPYPLVTRAIEAIGRSRILGVVLNRAEKSQVAVGYRY